MRGETIARNYAEALFEVAAREDELEEYGKALEAVAGLLDEAPQLRLFLETPRVEAADKKAVLREALSERIPGHVLNFLLVVVDRRRQRLIRKMAREYWELLDQHAGRAHVEVSVARPMGDEETAQVRERLSSILGKEAIPHVRVKPELIGGIAFRSGDTIFDGSVRRRLQTMRRQLLTTDVSTE